MKALVFALAMAVAATGVGAESLGSAAKREKERREKKKETAGETTVIDEAELARRNEKGGKGTYNDGGANRSTGTSPGTSGRASSSPSRPRPAASLPDDESLVETETEDDRRLAALEKEREARRQELVNYYGDIANKARSFVANANRFIRSCPGGAQGPECYELATEVGTQAIAIADAMEKVDEMARRRGMNPGDVRAARQRVGMDDASWDELVRLVAKVRSGQP